MRFAALLSLSLALPGSSLGASSRSQPAARARDVRPIQDLDLPLDQRELEASAYLAGLERRLEEGRYGESIFGIDVFLKQFPEELHPMIHPVIERHAAKAVEHFARILEREAPLTRGTGARTPAMDAARFWDRMLREHGH